MSSLRSIQRGKCLPQSVKTCEQSRETQSSCDFDEQRHTQEAWNRQESEFSARNVVLDLNSPESAALVDAHAKRCKLRTEAESARAETVAQRTSFADLEDSKSRLISELEELMTCSCQSGSKLDQAKHVSSSLRVESGRETGRSILEV